MTESPVIERFPGIVGELHAALAARPDDALDALAHSVRALVPGAEHVAVCRVSGPGLERVTATSEVAERIAALQVELADGPTLDVAAGTAVAASDDLAVDERWSGFGPRAAGDDAVRSVLALRVPAVAPDESPVILTLLSGRAAAFGDEAALAALALATCALLVSSSARHATRVANLERALETNRDIGTAVGVLMGLQRTTREHAFELLRTVSQTTHRKVSDIARVVAETGSLDAL